MGDIHFTLLDVLKETVRLTRARKTCFLVVLTTYTLAMLASQGSGNYFLYMARISSSRLNSTNEAQVACMQTIIQPWMEASQRKNLSASQQEGFYQAFKLNCSMFEDPPKGSGTYSFRNGSFTYNVSVNFASARSINAYSTVAHTLFTLGSLCKLWGIVVVAWVLYDATTNTPSYNNRPLQHRDPKNITTSEKLVGLFRSQFSGKVMRGVIRIFLTGLVVWALVSTTDSFGPKVRVFLVNTIQNKKLQDVNTLWVSLSPLITGLANPLRFLFLPCVAVAALEPGVWGFKALWRGIQLTRGNHWTSFLIYLLMVLWHWSISYVYNAITSKPADPAKPTEEITEMLWWSMARGSVNEMMDLPRVFLLPVFYFFCISLTEKVATMA